jgi:hypothetical protein
MGHIINNFRPSMPCVHHHLFAESCGTAHQFRCRHCRAVAQYFSAGVIVCLLAALLQRRIPEDAILQSTGPSKRPIYAWCKQFRECFVAREGDDTSRQPRGRSKRETSFPCLKSDPDSPREQLQASLLLMYLGVA